MASFVFRVDVSPDIGSGHLFRSLALANELRHLGGDVTWICRDLPGKLHSRLHREGFKTYLVPTGPWHEDADHTIEVLHRHHIEADWLIVDHYEIDRNWSKKVRPYVRSITQIDDLANRPLDCDVLVDPTPDRSADDYRPFVPEACRLLLGSDYALLRPEFHRLRFLALKRRRYLDKNVRKIMISLGSIDHQKYTMTALHALFQCRFDGEVHVILGEGAPHVSEVLQILSERFEHGFFHYDTDQMAKLMAEADLAIGGGGGSSWERCCLGLPTVVVETADNQQAVIAALKRHGAALYAGNAATTSDITLAAHIQSLLHHNQRRIAIGKRAAKLCDGLGARRVALILL